MENMENSGIAKQVESHKDAKMLGGGQNPAAATAEQTNKSPFDNLMQTKNQSGTFRLDQSCLQTLQNPNTTAQLSTRAKM